MAKRFIKDLSPGDFVEDEVFMIASKDLRTTTNGSLYIHAVLADRTGQLLARIWNATEPMYNSMPQGGFLRFRGRTESYKGASQFIIDAMRAVAAESVDLADFVPTTDRDIDEMFERVKSILRTVRNPYLLRLLKCYFDDQELMARFKKSPAAVQLHHAFVGGLLEHTLNVLELANLIIPRYPKVSLDLVLTGLFLHDLAKTQELEWGTSFSYSTQGQLVGHIVQGAVWLEQRAAQAAAEMGKPFPDELKWVLQHLIISHHGEAEFGSPKIPAMPEAIAVHYIDNLDAKLHIYLREIELDTDAASDWTGYSRSLCTKIYKRRPAEQHATHETGKP